MYIVSNNLLRVSNLILIYFYSVTIFSFNLVKLPNKLPCGKIYNTTACAEHYEKKLVKRYPGIIKRVNSSLKVQLLNGRYQKLADNLTDALVVELIAKKRLAILWRHTGGLGWTWYVVDRKTGNTIHTNCYPLAYSNTKTFACFNFDLEAGESDNVLKIYYLTSRQFKLAYQASTSMDNGLQWGPKTIRWLNENSLSVRIYHPVRNEDIKYDPTTQVPEEIEYPIIVTDTILTKKANRWRLIKQKVQCEYQGYKIRECSKDVLKLLDK